MKFTSWLACSRLQSPRPRRRKRRPNAVSAEALEDRTLLNAAPVVAGIDLVNDTGTPADFVTSDATIVGTVTDDISAAWLNVELDYNGDDVADNWLTTDEFGTFTHDIGLDVGYGWVNVHARALEWDNNLATNIFGSWLSLSFNYEAPPNDPPEVTALSLVNDTGTAADLITSDATFTGTVTNDGSVDMLSVELDYTGDSIPDDWTTTDATGTFTYDVGLNVPYGSVTVQARGLEFDANLGSTIYGAWVSLNFTYNANTPPVADTGGPYLIDIGQPVTFDASNSPDADGDWLSYEWDFDGDFAMQSVAFTDELVTLTWAELNNYGITVPGNYVIDLRVSDGMDLSAATTALLVQLPVDALDVTVEATENTPIVPVSQDLNFQTDSVEAASIFVQLSTMHIHVELPASASPSDYQLAFSLDSGARLWEDANRTTEVLPGSVILVPSQSYDLDLFVEDGQGTGTPAVSIVLESLLDEDLHRRIDRIFSSQEYFVPLAARLVEDEGVDALKDWLKDEAKDAFMDPYKQSIRNEITALLLVTDPADDPEGHNNLVNLNNNLDGYMDAALDALTQTAFDRVSDRLGFRIPTNSIYVPLFEEAANAPGTLEAQMGFEHSFGMKVETPAAFQNWPQIQTTLNAAMNGDLTTFESLVKNPATYIDGFSYKMDYTTVNGKTFQFEGGVSDFVDYENWGNNKYFFNAEFPEINGNPSTKIGLTVWPDAPTDQVKFGVQLGISW